MDFADAALIFAGVTIEIEDTRRNYGEKRVICYGLLAAAIRLMMLPPNAR